MRAINILAVMLSVLVSCRTPEFLTETELNAYIQDAGNGLTKEVRAGKVAMKVSYRPVDFLVLQEVGPQADTAEVAAIRRQYQEYIYFIFSLNAGEIDALYGLSGDQATFSENLQVLSFRMGDYVTLTTSGNDTIPVGDYVYNRTFGLTKSDDMLFAFNTEKVPTTADGWISFNIGEFGMRTGRRNFRFSMKDIRNTPRLIELQPSNN